MLLASACANLCGNNTGNVHLHTPNPGHTCPTPNTCRQRNLLGGDASAPPTSHTCCHIPETNYTRGVPLHSHNWQRIALHCTGWYVLLCPGMTWYGITLHYNSIHYPASHHADLNRNTLHGRRNTTLTIPSTTPYYISLQHVTLYRNTVRCMPLRGITV